MAAATVAPSRGFKGIWIPAELWLDRRISALARVLVAEIDSLSTDARGCWASDAYLAEMMGVSERHILRLLSQAEAAGWIERENFINPRLIGGKGRTIRCLWGYRSRRDCSSNEEGGGGDHSVTTLLTDPSPRGTRGESISQEHSSTAAPDAPGATPPRARACAGESKYPDSGSSLCMQKQKQSRTAVDGSSALKVATAGHAAGAHAPRARAHEEAASLTPIEERLAALKSPTATNPLPFPDESAPAATASDAAGLLGAFDTQPWDGEQGTKGGECSSETLGLPFTAIEEVFEEFYSCSEEEDAELPVDPRTPPSLPPAVPALAPDDGEAVRLLVSHGVQPDIAAGIAAEESLSRVRDVCKLASLRGWETRILESCFAAGWDREPANRRKLAAARGQPAAVPPPAKPKASRSEYGEFEPVDDAYRRHLRGEETPEERAKGEAEREFIRAEQAKLFPERTRPDGTRKQVVPPQVEPTVRGASDPRPIQEIMAERQRRARP